MPYDAGQRDRRVTIQQLTESVSAGSYPIETWSDLRDEWVAKMDMTGRERLLANQMTSSVDTKWRLEYSAAMDPELVDVVKTRQLVYLGRTYRIVSAAMIGRREAIELMTLAKTEVA